MRSSKSTLRSTDSGQLGKGKISNHKASYEYKKANDSASDEEDYLKKKEDAPVSDRIKDAALYVLRSSRSLSSKTKDSVRKSVKDDQMKTSIAAPHPKIIASASHSSAFQPIQKLPKASGQTTDVHSSKDKDSKLSVRERQRAYDEQVRKMNWKPLPIERPPPDPQPDKDAEILKAAEIEIFFPKHFGIPDDPFPKFSHNRDSVEEMKSQSTVPQPLKVSQHTVKPNTNDNGYTYVPARRATQPVQLPALLRNSMDINHRKSFQKPKEVDKKETLEKATKQSKIKKAKKTKSTQKSGKTSTGAKKQSKQLDKFVDRYENIDSGMQKANDDYSNDDQEDDEEIGEFEFSSDENDAHAKSDDESESGDDNLVEVPEIRLSLSERLNNYLGSRDVSILSGNTPLVSDDINRPSNGLRNSYSMNLSTRKVIEQSLAFGSEPYTETKEVVADQPKTTSRPPKPSATIAPSSAKVFTKPTIHSKSTAPVDIISDESLSQKLNIPKSTFQYDPADDSDDVDILDRLRPRNIHYRPYESDEESTGSLFRDDHIKDPEFGVVQTIMKKRQAYEEEQRRKQEKQNGMQNKSAKGKNAKDKRSSKPSRYTDDMDEPYRSSTASSMSSLPRREERSKYTDRDGELDLETLKEQIKREIQAEQAEAKATDDMWDEIMEKYESPRKPLPSVPSSSSDRKGDAYRLRMEIMDELRKQDELFQYTLELHELQSEMLQQTHPTIIIPTKPVVEEAPKQTSNTNQHLADTARDLLESANLNLFSTEQTIAESEQLLNLYRSLQDQQARAAHDQLQQQQMATLYNLQTLPILQDIQQSMELLQQQQEIQQRQIQMQQFVQPPQPVVRQSNTKIVHEAAIGTSAPSSPVRPLPRSSVGHEMDTQTSPVKPQTRQHPTFPYYHYAYQSNTEEEALYLGGGHGGEYERPTETALLKLQKVEQRQKERMAWLDHVIRMHLSTPLEAEEEREKIDELHRVELEQLRQSLRESREKGVSIGGRVAALQGESNRLSAGFQHSSAPESGRYNSTSQSKSSFGESNRYAKEESGEEDDDGDEEISDRGRSFLHLSPDDEDYETSQHGKSKSYQPEVVSISEEEESYNYRTRSGDEDDQVVTDDVEEKQADKQDLSKSTPESQRKSSDGADNTSHYYSLSEDEEGRGVDKEEDDDIVRHEEKERSDFEIEEDEEDSEGYEYDDFEASKSNIMRTSTGSGLFKSKQQSLMQSQSVAYSENDFEVEGEEEDEYTQEFSHAAGVVENSHDEIPDDVDEELIISRHRISQDEIVEDDIPSGAASVSMNDAEEDIIEDEDNVALAKSTQSMVDEIEDEDDEYEDDFVTSRSHSRILVPKIGQKQSNAPDLERSTAISEAIDYSVGDFEAEGSAIHTLTNREEEEYTATFDSAPSAALQKNKTVSKYDESNIDEEEEEYEPDYEEQSKSLIVPVKKQDDTNEYDYDNSFEPASASVSAAPISNKPYSAAIAALQDSTVSENIEEVVDDIEDDNDYEYEDDFAAETSRTSSVGPRKSKSVEHEAESVEVKPDVTEVQTQSYDDEQEEDEYHEDFDTTMSTSKIHVVPPSVTVKQAIPEEKNTNQDLEDDDVEEEIESVIEEDVEDESDDYGKSSTNQYPQKTEPLSPALKQDNVEKEEDDGYEDEYEFEQEEEGEQTISQSDQSTPISSPAKLVDSRVQKEDEEKEEEEEADYEDEDFDVLDGGDTAAPPSNIAPGAGQSPVVAKLAEKLPSETSSEAEEILDEEEIDEIEDFGDDDFEPSEHEDTNKPISPLVIKTNGEAVTTTQTSIPTSNSLDSTRSQSVGSQHRLVVDEDEDGALILEDEEESELSGANLRQRLIRSTTRSAESQSSMLSQQISPHQVGYLLSPRSPNSAAVSPRGGLLVGSTSSAQLSLLSSSSTASSAVVPMAHAGSMSSMRYDPDAQRWIGGDEVSMAGFSSTSSSSEHSQQPSPKATALSGEDDNKKAIEDETTVTVDRHVHITEEDSQLLVESSDESGLFLAEKEDSYIPIVRKAAISSSSATANTPATVAAAKPAKKVFDDDLDAFLDGLDDDSDDGEKSAAVSTTKVVTNVPAVVDEDEIEEYIEEVMDDEVASANVSIGVVSQSMDGFHVETKADAYHPVAPPSEDVTDTITDFLVKQWITDAILATQQGLGGADKPADELMMLPEANSFVLLDESHSFAHSSQDDLNNSHSLSTSNIIGIYGQKSQDSVEDEPILVAHTAPTATNKSIDDSQSIILASNLLDGDEEDEEDETSAQEPRHHVNMSLNTTSSTANNSSIVLAQPLSSEMQNSPLTTAEEAHRHVETAISFVNFEQIHHLLTSKAEHIPQNITSDCLVPSTIGTSSMKEWQRQLYCDRFDGVFRAIYRISSPADYHHHHGPAGHDDDDDLDPLLVHIFQPLSSALALKRFLQHHMHQEITAFQSTSNPHYVTRLQQHQQTTVSAAVNLSNNNNNNNNINTSNLNTSIQSLHSQLSQTLQQAQQTRPEKRHWDWELFDHGVIRRVQRQTEFEIAQDVDLITDQLLQHILSDSIRAATTTSK